MICNVFSGGVKTTTAPFCDQESVITLFQCTPNAQNARSQGTQGVHPSTLDPRAPSSIMQDGSMSAPLNPPPTPQQLETMDAAPVSSVATLENSISVWNCSVSGHGGGRRLLLWLVSRLAAEIRKCRKHIRGSCTLVSIV